MVTAAQQHRHQSKSAAYAADGDKGAAEVGDADDNHTQVGDVGEDVAEVGNFDDGDADVGTVNDGDINSAAADQVEDTTESQNYDHSQDVASDPVFHRTDSNDSAILTLTGSTVSTREGSSSN